MPKHHPRKTGVAATGLLAAGAVAAALAPAASAFDLKPGDIVVGTYANSSFGSGSLYVVDPVAGTVTAVPGSDFVSGVGAIAIDHDFNIVVGSYSNSSFGGGQLYRVNSSTNAVSQIGNSDFFNGVSSMHLIDANTAVVGTASASAFGDGALYTVDIQSGATTRLGPTTSYSHGVGGIGDFDSDNYLVGTQSVGLGDGALYTVNKTTGAATQLGSATFSDSVSALTIRPDGQIIVGSQSNSSTGTGRLYTIDRTTGAASTLGNSTYFNGVSALTTDLYGNVVMGTNNVTIGGPTSHVIGDPNFFSTAESATLDVADLLNTLGNEAASVRTGSGGSNSEPGNLTVAANLDFDGVNNQELTLRASNDIVIDGTITDSAGGDDELNLILIANNARQYPGITSGTGAVSINAAVALGNGSLTASGISFANDGGTIQSDSFVLDFSGAVVLTSVIDANNVAITAGSYSSNVVFDIAGDFNLIVAGDVSLGNDVTATDITTTGGNFDSTDAPITANGTLTLNHTGTVNLASTTAAQAIFSSGTDFTANDVSVDGAEAVNGTGVDLTAHTGNVTINGTFTVGDDGSDGHTGGDFASAGVDFTVNSGGELRVSEGVIDLSRHSGAITIDGVADSDGGMLVGTETAPAAGFTSNGSVNINADVTAFVSGDFAINGAWDSASLTVAANNFTFEDLSATMDLSIWNQLDITAQGDVTLVHGASVGSLVSRGVNFMAQQAVQVGGGDFDLSGHTGVVEIGTSVEVTSGDFYSNGTDFVGAGSFTVSGAMTLNHSGAATFGGPVFANAFDATVGSFDNAGGTLNIADSAVINSAGTVDFNDAVDAGSLEVTGSAIENNAAIQSNTGDITLAATSGNVNLAAQVTSAGALTTSGVDFTNSADVQVDGLATLNHTGDLNLNAAFTADALEASGNAFSFNTQGLATLQVTNHAQVDVANAVTLTDAATVGSWTSTGGDFTVSAGLESTAGDIDASGHAGAVAIDGVVTAAGSFSSGGSTFANAAAVTATGGDVNLSHSDTVGINAAILAAGGFSSTGTDFTSTATIEATSGAIDLSGHSGAVSFGDTVTAGGALSTAGTTFISGAIVTAGGPATLDHSGAVNINAAFASAGLDVQNSDSFSNAGGALTITGSAAINSASTVDISATVDADDFSSTGGGTFTNTAAIATDNGGVTLNHAGQAVAINAQVSATGGGFASTGSTFTSAASITATGAAQLTHTDAVNVNAALDAASLNASGSTFDNTSGAITLTGPSVLDFAGNVSVNATLSTSGLTSSGVDFAGNAPITTTTGGVDLTGHTGSVTIAGTVDATTGGFASAGSSFTNSAAITVGGASSVTPSGAVNVNAAFAADSLDVTGSSFDNTGGALTTTGAADIDVTGAATLSAAADTGSFSMAGSSVTTTAGITASAGGVALDGRSGAVQVGAAVSATGGGFTSNGSTFTSTAPIAADGAASLTHSGAVVVGSNFDAGSASISGSSFQNTGTFTSVGNMLVSVAADVNFDANVSAGALSSGGVHFDSRGVTTTVGGDMVLSHSGTVRLGDTTADFLDLGNAASVILASPAVVDVNTLDVTGVTQTTINTGATLDVAGAFTQTGNAVTLAGGLLRTSDLQTNGGTFNFFFGEVHVTTNLDIGDGFAAERVLGLTPDVTSGQTLRVTDTTTLYEPFYVRGGTFITGRLVNRFLLNFEYGTLRILADAGDDLVIGNDGQYGPQYTLGRTGGNQQNLELYAGDGGAGSITIRPEGTLLMEGGKAYAEGGITNAGRITFTDTLSQLSGGAVVNQSGGRIQGTGTIASTFTNQAGGNVSASLSEQLTFTGTGNSNSGVMTAVNGGTLNLITGITNETAGQINLSGGVLNLGKTTSYSIPPFNAVGGHLSNRGLMQVSGQSTITGDTVAYGGSRTVVAGNSTLSVFGEVITLNGEYKASTSNSTIIYFGTVRGLVNATGDGVHVYEGGITGLSPNYVGVGNGRWNRTDGGYAATIDIDGTTPQTLANYAAYVVDFDPARLDGRYAVHYYTSLTISPDQKLLVQIWTENNLTGTIYELMLGDTFQPITYGSLAFSTGQTGAAGLPQITLPDLPNPLWSWDVDWGTNALTLTVIPEPATLLLGAPLIVALTSRRRRAA